MAYEDYEEREQGLDRDAELYDDDPYASDGFGEQLGGTSNADDDDEEILAADDALATDDASTTDSALVEESFGETLTGNPHIEDQLEDERLSHEAESDYSEHQQNDSLIDKAKDKISEWTGGDKK